MTTDYDTPVAIEVPVMIVPAVVPAAIMIAIQDPRTVISMTVVAVPVAIADVDTHTLCAGDGRRGDRKCRSGGKSEFQLRHDILLSSPPS